jgi:hypothetical protein
MSESTIQPSRSQRGILAGLLIGGPVIAAIGAAMASSLGVWDLGRAEVVKRLAGQALGAWIWGNVLLGIGVAVTAAGLAALAAPIGGAVARSGAALVVMAGAIGAVGFLLQGVGNAEAADLLNRTGAIPGGFLVVSAIGESLLILFGGLAALGTLGIGVDSLQTDWLSRGVGVTVVTLALTALALLVLNIPFLALLGALVFGIGVLTPHRRATTKTYGKEV